MHSTFLNRSGVCLLACLWVFAALLMMPSEALAHKKSKAHKAKISKTAVARSSRKTTSKSVRSKHKTTLKSARSKHKTSKSAGSHLKHFTQKNKKNRSTVLQLKKEANKLIGTPYRYGGITTDGMDCSGLIKKLYAKLFGINLPHNAFAQSRQGFLEKVPSNSLQPGDLIFFGPGRRHINHVGVYLSNGRFLHAALSEGVSISSLSNSYWRSRFIVSKRVKGFDYPPVHRSLASLIKSEQETSYVTELGYNQALSDKIALSVGTYTQATKTNALFPSLMDATRNLNPYADPSEFHVRQGFRVAAPIKPFGWLAIAPTLGFVEGYNGDPEGSRRILGLEAQMSGADSRWSLAMAAARSMHSDGGFGWSMEPWTGMNSLDMALGLHVNLSDALRFSVIGARVNSDLSATSGNGLGQSADDLSFRFDFSF
jgi:cell wall-associated NlpC family hydrolase